MSYYNWRCTNLSTSWPPRAATSRCSKPPGKYLERNRCRISARTMCYASNGGQTANRSSAAMDLHSLADIYCRCHRGCQEYHADIRRSVRLFASLVGPPDTRDLTLRTLYAFIAAANSAGRWCPVSINNRLAHLGILWRFAAELGEAPSTPARLPRLPTEPPRPEAWSSQQIEQLLEAAACEPGHIGPVMAGQWWLAVLLVLYWTCARIGSLLSATPTDYVPSRRLLLLRKTKNGHSLAVGLDPQAADAVDRIYRVDLPRLFWWPYCRRHFYTRLRRIVQAAGLPAPRTGRQLTYKLRRTSLSLCWQTSPSAAQRLADHASARTTRRHYVDPLMVHNEPPPLPIPDFHVHR